MADYNIEKLKILVVDDDFNMCRLVSTILHSLGVKDVSTARSVYAGYTKLQEFEADIIICDLRMEPQDGIEFTDMIRNGEDSPNCYVPIIMLTGHAERTVVEKARDAGVNEFLAKPVSAKKLYQKIKSIIESPRLFVRIPDYFGPDRRRRHDPKYAGPERRKKQN